MARQAGANISQSLVARSGLGRQLTALLALAVLLGGGGVAYAINNLAVQLAALAILALNREAFFRFWHVAPLALRLLVAASIALPLLQLVPLPHDVVTRLPGRAHLAETMQLLGVQSAFPVSLALHRTLVAATALLVPLTVLALGWSLDRHDLRALLLAAVALAALHALIGFTQVLAAQDARLFYPENAMPGVLFGTFANRNSAGLFCVAALCLAIIPPWSGLPRPGQLARGVVAALLVLAVVLTQSRTAIVLTAIPLGLGALRVAASLLAPAENRHSGQRLKWIAAGLTLTAVLGISVASIVSPQTRLQSVIERFQQGGDARTYLWEDALFSAQRYWPVGAGMGTFDEVFQADEALENLTVKRAGRAHNDYLELAIEGGLAALVLLAAWIAYCAWVSVTARNASDRWSAWAGAAVLAVIALQSATDYPFRTMGLLALAALGLLALTRFQAEGEP